VCPDPGDERRTLEEQLRGREAELDTVRRELASFSYAVAHDLRAPLRAIDGLSRILAQDYGERLDAEGRRLLEVIQASTERMGELIDALLELSRVSRHDLRPERVRMRWLAEAGLEEASHALGPARRPVVTLGDLPDAVGDPVLLRQVWVHLCSNAVKFTAPDRPPRIEVSGHQEGDRLVYAVRDHGVGFEMRYRDRLFGLFQRLHSTREFPGAGVGLALVKRIVERHGGEVWGEGEVGKGAVFFFSLPDPEAGP
jgi:light-regulated signal transduction histidine kinase (bacteriophytochrome)